MGFRFLRSTTALAAGLVLGSIATAGAQDMSAEVINLDGQPIGSVTFSATPSGMVHVVAQIEGIAPGVHGFHVHAVGECDPETGFKSAGGHYAGDKEHGVLAEGGPHPGDFPNVHVGDDGLLMVEYFSAALSVGAEGENPLADADGSAVMVHEGADDYSSQPAGAAGSRVACGVIK